MDKNNKRTTRVTPEHVTLRGVVATSVLPVGAVVRVAKTDTVRRLLALGYVEEVADSGN